MPPADTEGRSPTSLLQDLNTLTKPRVGLMVALTAWVGYEVARGEAELEVAALVCTLIGVTLAAAASSVLNQVLEREHDARMERTEDRPLPTARTSVGAATILGLVLAILGVGVTAWGAGPLPALLTAGTAVAYLFLYTPLKRRTALNTIVGAFPGAMPPLIGWTAYSGRVEPGALLLFAILFLWQLPHFLSIAWLYREDYESGGYHMLPRGDERGARTARQMVLHCVLLIVVSLAPLLFDLGGALYAAGAIVVGGLFLASTLAFLRSRDRRTARWVLGASLLYVPGVFGLLALGACGPPADAWQASGASADDLFDLGEPVAEFALVDHDGKPFTRDDLLGRVWVVDFIFTQCGSVCPRMTEDMRRIAAALDEHEDARFLSISVDPTHDTPEVLREYAEKVHADLTRWTFLTGDRELIYRLAEQSFLVPVGEVRADGDIPHSERFLLLDRRAHLRSTRDRLGGADVVADVCHDVELLLAEAEPPAGP